MSNDRSGLHKAPMPTREESLEQVPRAEPQAVRAWLGLLPLIDIHRSARLIVMTLKAQHQQEMEPAKRLEILELIRPVAEYLCSYLRQKYLAEATLSLEKQKMIALAHSLQREMTDGYMLLTRCNSLNFLTRKIFTTAVHRAITHLTQILAGSYELYYSPPKALWSQLHQLYHLAEQQYLEDHQVSDTLAWPATVRSSISCAYKRALMLATANPSQLLQHDIEKIFNLLAYWVTRVHLYRHVNPEHLYVVQLNGEEPAHCQQVSATDEDAINWRAFDTRELGEFLQGILKSSDPASVSITFSEASITLSKTVVNALLKNWSSRPIRSSQRVANDGVFAVALGLSATHHFIGKLAVRAPVQLEVRALQRKGEEPDPWKKSYGFTQIDKGETQAINAPDPTKIFAEQTPEFSTQTWRVVNESDMGYCLQQDVPLSGAIQPGAVIGVQKQTDKTTKDADMWMICTIRWVKYGANQTAQVGIQLLATQASAVQLKGARQHHRLRGLILVESPVTGQVKTLLIPSIPYQAGDTVEILEQGRRLIIKLLEQLTVNGSYSQFSFEQLQEERGEFL